MIKTQEKYEELYHKVQTEMVENGYAKSLFDLCSVNLDSNEKENQINIDFLDIELEILSKVKNCFDSYSIEYGFEMNYTNLSGDLRVFS